MSETAQRQPFLEHVQELRGRLGWCVLALIIGTIIGYYFKDQLLTLLVAPLGQTLYYTSPGGGFSLLIQLCLSFGIIFAVPVFIFHFIRFLEPVVPNYSIKFLTVILLSSCILLGLGVTFAYFISLPAALYFLNEFSNEQIEALITTDTYMSFVTLYVAGFAVLFQLPLLLLIINSISPLKPKKLFLNTKWVILGSFIVAAVITPTPDPFNQAIMAGPIIVLYLLSNVLILFVNRHRPKATSFEQPIIEKLLEVKAYDTSELTLVNQREATYKKRRGEYCMWKYTDRRSNEIIVTFLFDGNHEFVKVYHPQRLRK